MIENKFVSLIIPVYNEEEFLNKLFKSIKNQDYPKNLLEIIIVDGNSSDKSLEIIKTYQDEFSNLIILNNPNKFVSFSLNLAIKKAKGDYIVRWDAHTIYKNDYLIAYGRRDRFTAFQGDEYYFKLTDNEDYLLLIGMIICIDDYKGSDNKVTSLFNYNYGVVNQEIKYTEDL